MIAQEQVEKGNELALIVDASRLLADCFVRAFIAASSSVL